MCAWFADGRGLETEQILPSAENFASLPFNLAPRTKGIYQHIKGFCQKITRLPELASCLHIPVPCIKECT